MTYADGYRAGLEAAARLARNACLVPPDGGEPTPEESGLCDEIADAICALPVPAAPEPSEAEPDMFWSKREGLYPEETPLEDWRDELDGADPFTPVEIEVGKRMGSRWVVYIPTEESYHWHDDCHMFATEADARAALAAMGRG